MENKEYVQKINGDNKTASNKLEDFKKEYEESLTKLTLKIQEEENKLQKIINEIKDNDEKKRELESDLSQQKKNNEIELSYFKR